MVRVAAVVGAATPTRLATATAAPLKIRRGRRTCMLKCLSVPRGGHTVTHGGWTRYVQYWLARREKGAGPPSSGRGRAPTPGSSSRRGPRRRPRPAATEANHLAVTLSPEEKRGRKKDYF